MIGGDAGADALIAGRTKLTIEVVKTISELTRFHIQEATIDLKEFFARKDLYIRDGFRKYILGHLNIDGEVCSNPEDFGHYADVTHVSTHDQLQAQLPELSSYRDANGLFRCIASMIVHNNPALLQDGRTNIFYTEAERFCIFIYRDAGEWIFSRFHWARRGRSDVCAGSRVFYFPQQD